MKNFLFLALIFLLACKSNTDSPKNVDAKPKLTKEELYSYDVEERIKSLGIHLKTPSKPAANYVNAVTTGNLVFLAGKGPRSSNGTLITGKIPSDLSVEEGYAAARQVGVAQLEALKAEIGDLNRVSRIVKVLGMVNADPDFTEQPEVINGFSDLMVEVFGEKGKHARAAVGMNSLPRNISCEIELIVEIQ